MRGTLSANASLRIGSSVTWTMSAGERSMAARPAASTSSTTYGTVSNRCTTSRAPRRRFEMTRPAASRISLRCAAAASLERRPSGTCRPERGFNSTMMRTRPSRAARSSNAVGTTGPPAARGDGARPPMRRIRLEPSAAHTGTTDFRIIELSVGSRTLPRNLDHGTRRELSCTLKYFPCRRGGRH